MGLDNPKRAETRSLTTEKEWILKSSKSKPGKYYYFNVKTGVSTWTRPEGFVSEDPAGTSSTNTKVPFKRKSDVNGDQEQKKAKADVPGNDSNSLVSTSNSSSVMEKLSENRKVEGKKGISQACRLANRTETASCAAQTGKKGRKRHKKRAEAPIDSNKRALSSPSVSSTIQSSTVCNATKIGLVSVNSRNPFTECHTNSEGIVEIANVGEHLPSETISSSHHESSSKRSGKNTSKEIAQDRLRKLQVSLKKKQSKNALKDLCSSNDLVKMVVSNIGDCTRPTGQHCGPAERRLSELRMNLKTHSCEIPVGSDSSVAVCPVQDSNNKFHGTEAMEVEYLESEVLFHIEELRQKDVNVDLSSQPVFMDIDMESAIVESDPKSVTYVVLDTNILLSHLNFTAELLASNLSGKGPAHLFIPWQVLHELDHLKDRGKSNIQPLARRAINFLHDKFSSKHSRIRGQKISEATLNATNCADDNILQSCLQLKQQCFEVILVSNDTNLRNKALVSDVIAVSKDQLADQIYKENKGPLMSNLPFHEYHLSNKLTEGAHGKENRINETFFTEFKTIIKETLTEVVSKGMRDQYKDLWEKRTVIPPPWEHDQVLHCLSHHWLAICDDFIPSLIREAILKLREFFKSMTKSNCTKHSDVEECLELTKAVCGSVSKKYSHIIDVGLMRLKDLESKLSGGSSLSQDDNSSLNKGGDSPSTLHVVEHDERIRLVLMCFEEAHNAALNICKAEYLVDLDHVQRAKCMVEAVEKLVHLLNMLLEMPISSLQEDNPELNELISLIKGNSSMTPSDLVLFLKNSRCRILIENGIGQFTSFKLQLEHMLRGAM